MLSTVSASRKNRSLLSTKISHLFGPGISSIFVEKENEISALTSNTFQGENVLQ